MMANIAWNNSGWRKIEGPDPKATQKYPQEHPAHESLNFDFGKKGVDDEKHVFGYVEWTNTPVNLERPGFIFFFTKNTKSKENKIVGVYGGAEILKDAKTVPWEKFENSQLVSNIRAEKAKSVLFEPYLDADRYKDNTGTRLVGQVGFGYIKTKEIAEEIIADSIRESQRSDSGKRNLGKLFNIFEEVTGKKCVWIPAEKDNDQKEQKELEARNLSQKQAYEEVKKLEKSNSEMVEYNGKRYKRYNAIIASLKELRNYQCQICHIRIKKKDGGHYIEEAHITPKSDGGSDEISNIMILCPNHHKEFDYGRVENMDRSDKQVRFKMNGKEYEVDLEIDHKNLK